MIYRLEISVVKKVWRPLIQKQMGKLLIWIELQNYQGVRKASRQVGFSCHEFKKCNQRLYPAWCPQSFPLLFLPTPSLCPKQILLSRLKFSAITAGFLHLLLSATISFLYLFFLHNQGIFELPSTQMDSSPSILIELLSSRTFPRLSWACILCSAICLRNIIRYHSPMS